MLRNEDTWTSTIVRMGKNLPIYCQLLNSAPWVDYFKQAGRETLEGSFSAVSTPIFASKYSFFRIFRDLSDSHPFVPLQIQKLQFFLFFTKNSAIFRDFAEFSLFFFKNFREFYRNFGKLQIHVGCRCLLPFF